MSRSAKSRGSWSSVYTQRDGFTLVELMIVVAIIGIIAAIALPNFVAMQYRAKRAEVPANINGIKTAEMAYNAAFDAFLEQSAPVPSGTPNKTQRDWTMGSAFDTLGWAPDGKVRGIYSVVSVSSTDILITGQSDIDGDSARSIYTASRDINATMTTASVVY